MKTGFKFAAAALFFLLVSCAIITVNIYFPEKDVKEAYKTLEKELMTPGPEGSTETPKSKPETKSESFLFRNSVNTQPAQLSKTSSYGGVLFELATPAYAETSGLADKIAEIVRKMPDVVQAYKEMGAQRAEMDRLRDAGTLGEANNGVLVPRENELTPEEKKLVDSYNEKRKTVVRGMAKAIVRINRLPENEENLKQVLPQATEQFAAIRRDSAKKGWWIQNTDGNWVKK